MAKEKKTISEIVDAHKPKNFKYKFIFTDKSILDELANDNYDFDTLDTINDDDLVDEALKVTEFTTFDRSVVARKNEPKVLDDGVILSKQMVTKVDKKLQCIQLGDFSYKNRKYILIRLVYERFTIIEIFILL
jgi:hypothetical protein